MAFEKYEETEDIIDWDWLDSQPNWFRKDVIKGKQKPRYKKKDKKRKARCRKKV